MTAAKSLFDNLQKTGSIPKERQAMIGLMVEVMPMTDVFRSCLEGGN